MFTKIFNFNFKSIVTVSDSLISDVKYIILIGQLLNVIDHHNVKTLRFYKS